MNLSEKTVTWIYVIALVVVVWLGLSSFDKAKYLELDVRLKNSWQNVQNQFGPLTKSPSPTPYVYHEPSDEQKKYLVALSAILASYNNENTDTLKSSLDPKGLKQLLIDYWDIKDRETALVLLEWLKKTGHRTEYAEMVDLFVRKNITACHELQEVIKIYNDERDLLCEDNEIKKIHDFYFNIDKQTNQRTLYAWDFGRLVSVARWSYSVGYISEEEAWRYIVPAGIKIKSTYKSWDDFGRNYLAGRDFWLQDLNGSTDFRRVFERLIDPSSQSVWTVVDWNTVID